MKLKNEVFNNNFIGALNGLIAEKLPVTQAYELRKFAKELDSKLAVYNESRTALINQYAAVDEEGKQVPGEQPGTVNIAKENVEAFNKDMLELMAQEEKYSIKKITLPNTVQISAKDLMVLEDIIEFNS